MNAWSHATLRRTGQALLVGSLLISSMAQAHPHG